MPDRKITELDPVASIGDDDLFVLQQGTEARSLEGKTLMSQLITKLNGRVGIKGIEKTNWTGDEENGIVDTYTITYSNNDTSTYKVTNGKRGKTGLTGSSGVYIGEDAPTDPDINVWIETDGVGFEDEWNETKESLLSEASKDVQTIVDGAIDEAKDAISTAQEEATNAIESGANKIKEDTISALSAYSDPDEVVKQILLTLKSKVSELTWTVVNSKTPEFEIGNINMGASTSPKSSWTFNESGSSVVRGRIRTPELKPVHMVKGDKVTVSSGAVFYAGWDGGNSGWHGNGTVSSTFTASKEDDYWFLLRNSTENTLASSTNDYPNTNTDTLLSKFTFARTQNIASEMASEIDKMYPPKSTETPSDDETE